MCYLQCLNAMLLVFVATVTVLRQRKDRNSILHSHWAGNLKMLLLVLLFICWGQPHHYVKIQAAIHHALRASHNKRVISELLLDFLWHGGHQMLSKNWRVTGRWKNFFSLRVEIEWLTGKTFKLGPWISKGGNYRTNMSTTLVCIWLVDAHCNSYKSEDVGKTNVTCT